MARFRVVAPFVLGIVAAGCVYIPLGKIPRLSIADLANVSGSVAVTPRVEPGGIRSGDPHIQSLVAPYSRADVDHVVIRLFRLSGSAETPVQGATGAAAGRDLVADVAGQDLDKTLTWSNLAGDTTFRVRAWAYDAPGESPGHLINDPASSSFVDLSLGSDERPAAATLPIRLLDRDFDGQASPTLGFADGAVHDAGTEVLE